jgi:hypothetical protein
VRMIILAAALASIALAPGAAAQPAPPTTARDTRLTELRQVASEAYLYLYPLVTMDITQRVQAKPSNALEHFRAFPEASFRTVVRPNFDTLYSMAWIDLSGGPVAIRVQPTQGRYYLLQFLDMWTDSFAIPGTRTNGAEPLAVALVPPGWQGQLPEGLARIEAPTTRVWMIGRTQTNGVADYAMVHAFQDGIRIDPLERAYRPARTEPQPPIDLAIPPRIQVDAMSPLEFLDYGARLLRATRPHDTDWSQIERLKRLGIGPALRFVPARLGSDELAALAAGVADARRALTTREAGINPASNGWTYGTETVGVYGNAYLKRAIIARRGLGANPPEDAVYMQASRDARGNPLQGGRSYSLRFENGQLPPAGAFWSVTLYDAEGFPVANPIGRHALGDRDPLRFNPDGSLDLLIQPSDPGGALSGNWLPAPAAGAITLTMRIYLPGEAVLARRWTPPAINPL